MRQVLTVDRTVGRLQEPDESTGDTLWRALKDNYDTNNLAALEAEDYLALHLDTDVPLRTI